MNLLLRNVGVYSKTLTHIVRRVQSGPLDKMAASMSTLRQHQASLPQMPVPPLDETLTKFLKSVKPFVTDEEFITTSEIVRKFGAPNGVGEKLQHKLEQRASKLENWLGDWWINTAYLDVRSPVVPWSSPALVCPPQNFNTLDGQLNYASALVAGALDYKIMIDTGNMPLDMMGKLPLDMSQHLKIFGTCRVPGVSRDSLAYHGADDPNPPKHIAVAHNNHFFKLDVYGKTGNPLNSSEFYRQLRNIVDRSTRPAIPIGILSSQNRHSWANNYNQLNSDKLNSESIDEIQRSIFVLCLDGPSNKSVGCKMTDATLQCLHANGASGNAGNRWFDKTLQFIVGNKGEVGVLCEHSPTDGPPVSNLMDHTLKYISKNSNVQVSPEELPKPKRLMFNAPSEIKYDIENAKKALESIVRDVQMTCFTFEGFGKDFIKTKKMSPDSFIQMALQFAFYRIHKEPSAQYESASLRMFVNGRTDAIRSCSGEAVAFSQTMLDPSATNGQKALALRAAVEAHKQYVTEAVRGCGIDRHLLGLKLAAIESGMDVPSLFMDEAYTRSTHMRVSTSQVSGEYPNFMSFVSDVPGGYGCIYNPQKETVIFAISALNSCANTDSFIFRQALEESCNDMKDVLIRDGEEGNI